MKRTFIAFVLLAFVMVSQARAHNLWINCFESYAHKPGHALISLGWGHGLPMDDILNSSTGKIRLATFQVVDPSGLASDLGTPVTEVSEPSMSNVNFTLFAGDNALQKLAFKETMAPGVYQLSATSRPAFYTQYVDTKGRTRLKMKPKSECKNVDKVLMSVKYQAFAKAFITHGPWQPPKPLGHGLEIIPSTDLGKVKEGDLVRVEVLFYGKPLTTTAKSQEYITASGSGFGQKDGFSLFSDIVDGKAQFRVQSPGQWRIIVKHKEDVSNDGSLKELVGKADQVYHAATLTFDVN
ncbi:MAG: DUF4198 domain-containing protein [Desulfobacteraceae bacterium]|nr:DUF4198 domain-containing protein [Desulfobacteraceae bacterium]